MAYALAREGVQVAVLDLNEAKANAVRDNINSEGGVAIAIPTDVLSLESLEKAAEAVVDRFGTVDILINGAGGNKADATTSDTKSFFDLPAEAIQWSLI